MRFDFNADSLYEHVDDFNLGYIDASSLRRFLTKCGLKTNEQRIVAIVRRWDLNADAKLTKAEFFAGITPQESYTRLTTKSLKKQLEKRKRPQTAVTCERVKNKVRESLSLSRCTKKIKQQRILMPLATAVRHEPEPRKPRILSTKK